MTDMIMGVVIEVDDPGALRRLCHETVEILEEKVKQLQRGFNY